MPIASLLRLAGIAAMIGVLAVARSRWHLASSVRPSPRTTVSCMLGCIRPVLSSRGGLAAMIALHLAGALHHALIRKDGVFSAMIGRKTGAN